MEGRSKVSPWRKKTNASGKSQEKQEAVVLSEKVYVAVGRNMKEEWNKLLWSLEAYQGAKVAILHVHQPSEMAPGPSGGWMRASKLKASELKAFRELERQEMMQAINGYWWFCASKKVEADHLIIESKNVGKGIVELVAQHDIGELVMGAAADKSFSKKMKSPISKKAIYVNQHALPSCRIRFVCKGTHIRTREPYAAISSPAVTPSPTHSSPGPDGGRRRSFSGWFGSPQLNYTNSPSPEVAVGRAEEVPRSPLNAMGTTWSSTEDGSSRRSLTAERTGREECPSLEPGVDAPVAVDRSFPQTEAAEEQYTDNLILFGEATLQQMMVTLLIIRIFSMAFGLDINEAEHLSVKEQRLRKEAAVSRERLQLEMLREMSVERASLERRITEVVHELEEKNQKLDDLLHALDEMEREKMEMQRQMEDAMAKVEELNIRQEEFGEASRMAHSFTEFSLAELVDATNGFDPGLKIGEGGFGTVYRGRIRYTTVAIKMLNSESTQAGGSEFHQEVNVLSRVRHPHLVTFIGGCTEACALVYEYLPNGSLEDGLSCKDGTPPLTWQARTSIAAEICSALLFLHSAGVVHGDLKPGNILLDAKLSAKIGNFGICHLLPEQDSTVGLCVAANPNGAFAYLDPEFLATGELTPLSDVYSFGVIILQLLTGRSPLWIARDVQKFVFAGNLQALIDPAAGDWPFVQAVQLANLGLECCNMSCRCRPDLETEVWRVLEPLKGSLAPSTHCMVTNSRQPPEYFICPIFQETMQDPQVAADGFTYEAEALRGWLDSGHDTSPMTNLKLSHLNLTPNHALRSAVQEWCRHC
ncbi:U-box domain-containing protein 33-like [Nymphaea colorata]|nr:U-box domain-containing protein 33-like [Nymphaea colorata]